MTGKSQFLDTLLTFCGCSPLRVAHSPERDRALTVPEVSGFDRAHNTIQKVDIRLFFVHSGRLTFENPANGRRVPLSSSIESLPMNAPERSIGGLIEVVSAKEFLRSLTVLNGFQTGHDYCSLDYNISLDKRLVSAKLSGKVNGRGLETYALSLRSDPRFDPSFAELVDIRQVTEIELQPEEALRLADELDPFSRESRRAFVVLSETQMYAAKMHQLLLSGRKPISIFSSIEEATGWITQK